MGVEAESIKMPEMLLAFCAADAKANDMMTKVSISFFISVNIKIIHSALSLLPLFLRRVLF